MVAFLLAALTAFGAPTPKAQVHALAFAAFLNSANRDSLDSLSGAEEPVRNKIRYQTILRDGWNTETKEDLLKTLHWLQSEGHRQRFAQIKEELQRVTPEFLIRAVPSGVKYGYAKSPIVVDPPRDQRELERRYIVMLDLRVPPGRVPPLTAWDLGRYITICVFGYRAGYITETEAWDLIMPVARLLQASFDSWQQYSADYVYGRVFWSPEEMRGDVFSPFDPRAISATLLAPGGLWAKIPWRESLGKGPVAEDHFKNSLAETGRAKTPDQAGK